MRISRFVKFPDIAESFLAPPQIWISRHDSVTRLGNFLTFFEINFLAKVIQIFGNILGYFEWHHSWVKKYLWLIFGQHFGKHWLLLFQHLVTLCHRADRRTSRQDWDWQVAVPGPAPKHTSQFAFPLCSHFPTFLPRYLRWWKMLVNKLLSGPIQLVTMCL